MESLPDAIIQQILSQISSARDIAVFKCVSKRWKECVPYLPSLYFPRNFFDGAGSPEAEASIARMIVPTLCLKELVMYCPFSATGLASWLSLKAHSLRTLELRMDGVTESKFYDIEDASTKIDCIDFVKGLECLKLWGICLVKSPKWTSFHKLHELVIVGAHLQDHSLADTLRACPNLTDLTLLGCEGANAVNIELMHLENCRLDFLGAAHCMLSLCSPKLKDFEVQGFSWIRVNHNNCLRRLSICKSTGRVYGVDIGKLDSLEYLNLRGVQWCWNALYSVLQCATEVKQLVMKVEFCGEFDKLLPFPQIDLVDFFNNHPKLRYFEIHGAMFAALCQKDSLKHLDSKFNIPYLEHTVITVRSPLNAEQKLSTLESLVRHSSNLQKMVIRISRMRNCDEIADDFFEEIFQFARMNNKVVRIE